MKNKTKKYLSLLVLVLTLVGFNSTASAAILFQDDTFATIESDAIMIGSNDAGAVDTLIQFGADAVGSENGNIRWNIATNTFSVDHGVDITGGLTADGYVDFSSATGMRIREVSAPNTNAACATLGELVVDTSRNPHMLMISTTTGGAGVCVWADITAADADTVDGLHATQFLRSDANTTYNGGTITIASGSTQTVLGAANFGGSTQFVMRNDTTNPLTCVVGELFFNTTSGVLQACTATNTWTAAGPQDFEGVYAQDADNTLTTGNSPFTINTGSGSFSLTSTGTTAINGATSTVAGSGASNQAVYLNASNAAGGITAAWGTGGLNFSGTGAANLTTTGATSDMTLTAGRTMYFDDANLLSAIKLTNTATGWAATLTGGGIIDNINSFTTYTAGEGSSNVGVENGTLTNIFTGGASSKNVQETLNAINGLIGSGAPNVDTLVFSPEFPDTVLYRDGSANSGTMVSDFDSTNDRHYYRWTTNNAALQDLDIRFKFPLPADFKSIGDFVFNYRTGTVTTTDNKVDAIVKKGATTCGSSTGLATANTWATGTITAATLAAGCATLAPQDILTVALITYDKNGASTRADIGSVTQQYNN